MKILHMNLTRRFYFLSGILFLTARALSAPLSILDDLSRVVVLSSPAQRIVSLAPSITETLFAVGSSDQVVGVTDYCNFPESAKKKTRVGGVVNPSIEAIISLTPDLIILSMEGNVREDFNKLLSFGIPVFVTNPRSLSGIHKSIMDIGVLTGHTQEAVRLVHGLQTREDSVTRAAFPPGKRILFIVSLQPLIVVGSNSFLAELLERAGGFNVAATSPSTYPTYSRESVVKEKPEVLFVMSDVVADVDQLVTLFPEWRGIDAVRTGSVHRIDADIVSRPGPRAIDGLEILFHFLHGEHK